MTNGWKEVPLKEIAKPISRSVPVEAGTEYRTIGVRWWGMGAYERETIDGSRTAAKSLSIVREGDLIINKIWVRHGSVAIANKDVDGCAGSGEFPTFELDLNRIDPKWIHWQTKMKSFWGKCDSLSQGTSGKNRIKPELFLTINIPLPSLDIQRRILERVEILAARIENAQSLRDESDIESDILLQTVTRKLLGNPISNPLSWNTKKLKEVTDLRYGISAAISSLSDSSLGTPIVRMANIALDGTLDLSDMRYYVMNDKETENFLLQPNDLLLNWRSGSEKHIGKTALFDQDGEYTFASFLLRLRCDHNQISPKFLKVILNFMRAEGVFISRQRFQVNTKLNATEFGEFDIFVPPLDEQRRIVAYLDSVQARLASLRELQSQTGEELDALLPSILDKAFRGEL